MTHKRILIVLLFGFTLLVPSIRSVECQENKEQQAQNTQSDENSFTPVKQDQDKNVATELNSLKARVTSAELDDTQQKAVLAILTVVESNIKRSANSRKQITTNQQLADSAAIRASEMREALQKLDDELPTTEPKPDDLVNVHAESRKLLEQAQAKLNAIQLTINIRREPSKTASTIENLQAQQKEQESKLSESRLLTENALVAEATELELRSTTLCISAEIERLLAEKLMIEEEEKAGYLIAANEYWATKVKRLSERSDLLQIKLEQQRRNETQQSENQAKAEVSKVPSVLKSFAEQNARVAELATSILEPLKKAQANLKAEQRELDQLQKQFVSTENRVKAVGLTASVGAYLRNRKSEIPLEGWLKPVLVDRLSEIEKYQSQQFDLQEGEQSLITDEVVNQAVADAGAELSESEQEPLKKAATDLVNRRRELLSQAIANHKDYLATLTQLQNTESELGNLTTTFHEYINERILWIRSNNLLLATVKRDRADLALFDSQNWLRLGQKLFEDVRRHILTCLLAICALVALFFDRIRMRKAIFANAESVSRGTNTAFWPTLETTVLTIAVALPIPLLLGLAGWRLANIVDGTELTIAVGRSMISAGWFFFLGETLRQICRKNGLADSHFGWMESTANKLNRELGWFVPFGAIASFVCSLLYLIDVHHETDTLERICFILAISAFAIFLFRTFHPQHGMFREYVAINPNSWMVQSRKIAFWLIMAIPASLIFMIVIGYYYSAIQMLSRLFSTLVMIVGLEVVRSLILRFVQLSRRKARIEQSRARLKAQSASDESEQSHATSEMQRAADVEAFLTSENDALDENFERSRKLIAAGIAISWVLAIAMIWADVFPALKGLDRYVFWTTTVDQVVADNSAANTMLFSRTGSAIISPVSNGESSIDQPANVGETESQRAGSNSGQIAQIKKPVTLRNFLVAIFILCVSIFALKNLPAFIELVFLKHLPLEQSLRHAIRAISGYVILMIGVIAAGRAMYIGWNQIQWLATALTFGLAFGLQEIFANFIAGIILLLERPIRIGDIVQVDDITGVVTKIRIRATTIRNFDQKEFIVPNKDFITGRLLNWTLADKIVRQTIRVGVAYGSDVRKAKKIIQKISKSHSNVLDEPKTVVTFEEFGDSSLNLTARIFLKDFDAWWSTMDDINLAIDDEFKAAGIEISFPQRDLHLRTVSPEFERTISKREPKDRINCQSNME